MTMPSAIHYDLLTPSRIVFGWGRRREAGGLASTLGTRAFLVSGSRTLEANGLLDQIESALREQGVDPVRLATISHEPEVADVDQATAQLLGHHPDANSLVLAVGGGSAIDLAKAVAAMATNRQGESVVDFLEGVGRGLSIENAPLPVMAMPTTSGTGSEATKNSVISSYDPPFKKSLRSEIMVPRIVLVDPELSLSVPPTTTAHTGMDTITQLIESYISRRAQRIPEGLAQTGLRFALGGEIEETAIVKAVEQGNSVMAREKMAQAALLSGMALANSGLGMAHGVAAALGVHCRVPHGLACAVMLPTALRVNRSLCEFKLCDLDISCSSVFEKTPSNPTDRVDAFIARIETISTRIGIPGRLSEIGVTADQLPAIVQSSRGNSMNGNPRELSDDELLKILEELL